MTNHEIFELGDFAIGGTTLPDARLAYRTYGELNADKSNAILFPTWFAGTHEANEWLIGEGRALDTARYFVIAPSLFGNALSSSPSNTPPPYDRARFPHATMLDNVRAQHRLVTERFGISRLALVLGASMGAGQTYQWAVSHPGMVERIATITGSPRTSPHNQVFLEGLRSALTADSAFADGEYEQQPRRGLRAFARVCRMGPVAGVLLAAAVRADGFRHPRGFPDRGVGGQLRRLGRQ
jgi:homoserine O-acetyltransferase/O-succinyltransferase